MSKAMPKKIFRDFKRLASCICGPYASSTNHRLHAKNTQQKRNVSLPDISATPAPIQVGIHVCGSWISSLRLDLRIMPTRQVVSGVEQPRL